MTVSQTTYAIAEVVPVQVAPVQVQPPRVTTTEPVAPKLLAHQTRFRDLIEWRGEHPRPSQLAGRLLKMTGSWVPLVAGACALVGEPIAHALGLPLGTATGAGVIAGLVTTFLTTEHFTYRYGRHDHHPPLRVLTSRRHLEPHHFDFLDGVTNPLEQAALGLQIRMWLKRIDRQEIHGEAAYARLEAFAAKAGTLPDELQEHAKKLVALVRSQKDDDGDWATNAYYNRLKEIRQVFEALPPEERRAAAPLVLARFYKGDVCRYDGGSHEESRELYRALRAALADDNA